MERTINSESVVAYYNPTYIFTKLKRRVENEKANQKIKIGEPIKVKLEVVDLGVVE